MDKDDLAMRLKCVGLTVEKAFREGYINVDHILKEIENIRQDLEEDGRHRQSVLAVSVDDYR